jgi:hypothetical protein
MDILAYAAQKMKEAGINNYQAEPVLIDIKPNGTENVGDSADYYFSANMFSQAAVFGTITASNTVLNLSAEIINSEIAKVKGFRGPLRVINRGTQTLYIEFLKVSPIKFESLNDTNDINEKKGK